MCPKAITLSLMKIKRLQGKCCDNLIHLIFNHEVNDQRDSPLCACLRGCKKPMNLQTIKASCSNCNLRELCMPMGLDDEQMERIDEIVATRRKV